MKPIENKQAFENELIDHIRENLTEHEEAYRLGAWEDFNQPKKKKRAFFWIEFLGAAAAILLIAFISFLLMNNPAKIDANGLANSKKTSQKNNLQTQEVQEKSKSNSQRNNSELQSVTEKENYSSQNNIARTGNAVKENQAPALVETPILISREPNIKNNNSQTDIAYLAPKNNEFISAKISSNQIVLINKPILINPVQKHLDASSNKRVDIIEFLEKESKKNQIAKNKNTGEKKAGKFTLGIMVAPSFSNAKKLNMGYGLGVDYSFSDKLSISSGIAYNQMGGAKNLENSNSALLASDAGLVSRDSPIKTLKYFEENIAGIDIPLEFKYYFNKNIYANAGVSALAVIKQSRSSVFLEEKVVERIETAFDGGQEINTSFVNEKVTEKAKIDNYSLLGFYIFSLGYKKKILKKNTVAIEPFVKLPMREFNAENLKLMGTGLKLKLDF